jgi:DUF3011 family protein
MSQSVEQDLLCVNPVTQCVRGQPTNSQRVSGAIISFNGGIAMARVLACVFVLSCAVPLFAQVWPCESTGGAYRECRIGSSGVIKLVMEMSDRQCFEGISWGTREPGVVWVNRNCRATFTVDKANPGARVVCESLNGGRAVCLADIDKGVALTRQLSKDECFEGLSWGYDAERNLIWVDRGCRGEFTVGRPFAHLPRTPPLDTPVLCESANKRRTVCAADTAGGVQIVRTVSDAACRFGQEWGYDAKGIWVSKGCRAEFVVRSKPKPAVRTVTCESEGNKRRHCAAETQFGLALIRQIGDRACVLDTSWGFDKDGVWVTDGCRAQFALGGFRLPADAIPENAARVVCESVDGKRAECGVGTSRGVGLVRQISSSDCVLNRSWGYGPDAIWVSDGCRAEFAVAK